MSHRAVISVTNGNVEASFWTEAARAEPPTMGKPIGCAGCPLRVGGEWAEGAKRALSNATPAQRATLKRWGCHESARPCAGMRRILAGERT